jgi:hypothetical protein
MKELSLRPYHGRLFLAKTRAEYERGHKRLFNESDVLNCSQSGRFTGGEGKDGMWTYLVYADDTPQLSHEFCHVLFNVWERCGMNPNDSGGESFCYMLSQLLIDAKP